MQVRMRPSRAASAVLMFVGLVFLVFGLVLVQVGTGDANEPEQRLLVWLFGLV
jgi:hypothetical protein